MMSNNPPEFLWDKDSWAYLNRRRLMIKVPSTTHFTDTPFWIKNCKRTYERHLSKHRYSLYGSGMHPGGGAAWLDSDSKVKVLMERAELRMLARLERGTNDTW